MRILAFWLMFSSLLQAQRYVFRVYGQAEGLKNLAVNAMTIDHDGFLWVATENGVYRFLGSDFERFGQEQGIDGVDVRDVYADPDGRLWVGTDKNLFVFDGRRFFAAGSNPIEFQGPHRMVAEDARHLLVVDKRRLFRLEHDADGRMVSYLPVFTEGLLASYPELDQVVSVSLAGQGGGERRIWLGGGKDLYSLPDRPAGGPLGPRDGEVASWDTGKGLPADRWAAVHLDRSGTLWAQGMHHVAALPPQSSRFVDRDIPGTDPESVMNRATLIEDPQGRILATTDAGIARWDGGGWTIIGQASGLVHSSYFAGTVFDADGDLWLGSRGDGLIHWTGYANWEGWATQQGLPSAAVWTVASGPPADVMVGTEKGPAAINVRNGTTRLLFSPPHWTFSLVQSMDFDPDGALFAATLSGRVLRIDPANGVVQQKAKLPALIITAFRDRAGRRFFGTAQGIYVSDPAVHNGAPQKVPAVDRLVGDASRVEAGCVAADGSAWFVTDSRLIHFEKGQWSIPLIDGMQRLNGALLAISCAPDGSIWVTGEQAGAWKVTGADGLFHADRLELPGDLRSLACLAILIDRRGWVWLGSDSGLAVWNGKSWRHLTQESGLISNDLNQGALRESQDGSIWIGTSGGVSRLAHPELVFDEQPLGISLVEIRHGSSFYFGLEPITLPWGGPALSFRVASPAARNRSELSFKIRMEGLHPDWIEVEDGVAVFSRLAPGDYAFTAMACNASLNACSATVRVPVRILPPWWRSNWFFGVCGLAFVLLLMAADRLRARHLKARSRQLEAMVRERTLELEASREQLRIQAIQDGLTGMLNHVAVLRALAAEMDRACREQKSLVVAMVDLDHFKRVNDQFGHLAGDEVLRSFAAAVRAATRGYDRIGRYGGEEFLLVLTEIPSEAVEQRLTGLHAAISNLAVEGAESEIRVTCSIGATVYDPSQCCNSAESLLAIADKALYTAKEAGRNRVVFRR